MLFKLLTQSLNSYMREISAGLELFLSNAPIFYQPWWLESVAPSSWDIVTVTKGEEVVACFPYCYKVRLKKYRLIEMPPLTPYLGPIYRNIDSKHVKKLGEEKKFLFQLLENFPKFDLFDIHIHPSFTNWLPFYWKGFSQSTLYTYIVDGNQSLDEIWKNTRENIRRNYRKAQKTLEIKESNNIDELLRIHKLTFERQKKQLPYDPIILQRIFYSTSMRKQGKVLTAIDTKKQIHASVFIVWDSKTVYYLIGAGDPELRNSGANTLLLWESIKFANSTNRDFDFEGSMVENIERYFRAFGAIQKPYFNISKSNSLLIDTYRKLYKFSH